MSNRIVSDTQCRAESETTSDTIRARISYCAYEMKSTLSFALQRELASIAMIGERHTHLLVIANMEGSRF